MEIRTKFNVNNTIWLVIPFDNLGLTIVEEVIITRIKIYITEDTVEIMYDTKTILKNNFFNNVYEKFCFATKEEAQKECDRRNGK